MVLKRRTAPQRMQIGVEAANAPERSAALTSFAGFLKKINRIKYCNKAAEGRAILAGREMRGATMKTMRRTTTRKLRRISHHSMGAGSTFFTEIVL